MRKATEMPSRSAPSVGGGGFRPRAAAAVAILALVGLSPAALHAASPAVSHPFTSALIHFEPGSGVLEKSDAPFTAQWNPAEVFYFICWPPGDSETNTAATGTFDVDPDGTFDGSCQATRNLAAVTNGRPGEIVDKQGTLTGRYDVATGRVEFHLEAGSTYDFNAPPACSRCDATDYGQAHTIVVDGPVEGGQVVGDHAEGRARYTYSCRATHGRSPDCGVLVGLTATVAFFIDFFPALASGAPGAPGAVGGSTGGGTGGGSSPVGGDATGFDPLFLFLLLIFVALILMMLLLRLAVRGRDRLTPAEFTAGVRTAESLVGTAGVVAGPESEATAAGSSQPADGSAATKVTDVVDFGAGMIGPDHAPPTPPAPASAAAPAGPAPKPSPPQPPPTSPSGGEGQKPPELVMTEDIVLAAELADPEKPPTNRGDL